jgi:predicted RNA methylase
MTTRQAALFDRRDLMVEAVAPTAKQAALEAFYTPPLLADFCVSQLTDPRHLKTWLGLQARCVEPSAGGGAFVEALLKRTPHVHAVDIDPDAAGLSIAPASSVEDFLDWEPDGPVDWVVGNPPYGATQLSDGNAEAHARKALSIARVGVAVLLRQGFVASQERIPFWSEFPGALRIDLLERPSFTGRGVDQYDYAFIVWLRGHRGPGRWLTASWRTHRVPAPAPLPDLRSDS